MGNNAIPLVTRATLHVAVACSSVCNGRCMEANARWQTHGGKSKMTDASWWTQGGDCRMAMIDKGNMADARQLIQDDRMQYCCAVTSEMLTVVKMLWKCQ